MKNLAAVVLASGRSTRMGRDKLSLPWLGGTVLDAVLSAAHVLSPVVLVGGYAAVPGVTRVIPDAPEPEQSRSLQTGIMVLPPDVDGAMVFLGDMPLVTPNLVGKLAETFRPGRFLVPAYRGRRGNPVIIPSVWFEKVMEIRGDTGARPLLTLPGAPVDILEVDDPAVVTDLDTPEDYARLKNQPRCAEP